MNEYLLDRGLGLVAKGTDWYENAGTCTVKPAFIFPSGINAYMYKVVSLSVKVQL